MRKKTTEGLKRKLWTTISLYIRLRGKGICVTCGAVKPIKGCHAGHFVHMGRSNSKKSNRLLLVPLLDEINLNCQCAGCNMFKHGDLGEYAMYLNRKYNNFDEIYKRIKAEKMKPKKPTIEFLEDLIKLYEHKTECLKQ